MGIAVVRVVFVAIATVLLVPGLSAKSIGKSAGKKSVLKYWYGQKIYKDGSKYIGEWRHGKRDGEGTYYYLSGDIYSGGWLQGKRHGKGTYMEASGRQYTGQFYFGSMQGWGKMIWAKGHSYIGEFRKNAMNGRGTLLYNHGLSWSGTFRNGRPVDSEGYWEYQNADDPTMMFVTATRLRANGKDQQAYILYKMILDLHAKSEVSLKAAEELLVIQKTMVVEDIIANEYQMLLAKEHKSRCIRACELEYVRRAQGIR